MSFSGQELDEILTELRDVAGRVSGLLLDGLGKPKRVTYKGDVDLVTEYDRRAEALIVKTLEKRFPHIGMLAEESGSRTVAGDARWIVDPLDGTTNYAHGQPIFAVSIGLEEKGELVAGVVAVPTLGLTAWARKGGGAFRNGEPARVSGQSDLGQCLVATGFPYDRQTATDDNTRELVAVMKKCQGIRRCGAAAVDLAFVACGVYDGFFEPRLQPWDLAAGVVLVREAGGLCTDYAGADLDIHTGWIIASNGLIHDRLIDVIKEARKTL